MSEYIKREDALDIVKRTSGDYAAAFVEIAHLPAEDVAEVRHAHWYDVGSLSCRCSGCGCKSTRETVYCPNCNAKMDEKELSPKKPRNVNSDDIQKLIDIHGERETLLICMEEAAEYIQAITKLRRVRDWGTEYSERRKGLIEEIADLTICMHMSRRIYHIAAAEVAEEVRRKMERNLKRVGDQE